MIEQFYGTGVTANLLVTTIDSVAASQSACSVLERLLFKFATIYHEAIGYRPSFEWEPRFARN